MRVLSQISLFLFSATLAAVGQSLTITQQPTDFIAAAGYKATFSVTPRAGSPILFQWQKDGSVIFGATNSALTITNVSASDAGVYGVVVTSGDQSVTSSNALLRVIPAYTFTTLAGWPGMRGINDGVGPLARFINPHGIAADTNGNIYVTDISKHTVAKISPDGAVSTIAGLALNAGYADGQGSGARFNGPWGVSVDHAGNLLVADTWNRAIRKITPNGTVSTIMKGTPFVTPASVIEDSAGNLFVADEGNSSCIWKLTLVSNNWVATNFVSFYGGFCGLGIDRNDNLYVADEYKNAVLRVTPGGAATVLAGGSMGFADGLGSAAKFTMPHGGTVDKAGNVWVVDAFSDTVRRITPDGIVTTVAGMPGVVASVDGTGMNACFSYPRGITTDSAGNLYVTDFNAGTIRKGVPFPVNTLPKSQGVPVGGSVTLAVDAPDAVSYQWLSNNMPMADQTGASLQLNSITRAGTGFYSVAVTNHDGNSITFHALIRGLTAPKLQPPASVASNKVRMLFQDQDGGMPYDLSQVEVQCCTNLPSASESTTNWQPLQVSWYLTNGFVAFDDTNDVSAPRFYRLIEH